MKLLSLVCIFVGLTSSVLSQEAEEVKPILKILPKSAIGFVGEKKGIFCQGVNFPDGQKIEWLTPAGEPLQLKSVKNTRVYMERPNKKDDKGKIHAALMINNAKIEDSGNWTCKAGEYQDSIEVIIGEKVKLENDTVIIANEGETVKLGCTASGDPAPTVQWYMNNYLITESEKYKMRKRFNNNYTLEILNVAHNDSGIYVCKFTQKRLWYFVDRRITLHVLHQPILLNNADEPHTAKMEEVYAILNEVKVIRCKAIANPPPKYMWKMRKNNYDEVIEEDQEIENPISVKTAPDNSYSELTLMMRDTSYLGQYKCEVTNEKGRADIVYDVTLGAKPLPPDNVTLVSANNTELIFEVSTCANRTSEILEQTTSPRPARKYYHKKVKENKNDLLVNGYHFQFVELKENYPPDWDSTDSNKIDIEVDIDYSNEEDCIQTFVVGPLPNSTKFEVRIRSRNAAGYSDWLKETLVVETSNALRLTASVIVILLAYFFSRR